MKKFFLLGIILILTVNILPAQMTVSGILDSTVSMSIGSNSTPGYSFGLEEYANIRFQSRMREKGTVHGAVNLIAGSGSYAAGLATQGGFAFGNNFAAAIELERLYFRIRGDHIDFDGGLFRLPFGYSQVWGSSDFLNPRNPLTPNARPRAILGASVVWYPIDELKMLAFYSAPRNIISVNTFNIESKGSFIGLSLDRHFNKSSIQGLYAFETPSSGSKYGVHRVGLSIKADIEIGIIIDALYTYNHQASTRLEGLSLSLGADYSFFSGKLMVLAEYLYNGEASSTVFDLNENPMGLFNRHNLYTGFTLLIDDFTNMNFAVISSINNTSIIPVATLNRDLFQGAVLTASIQALFIDNTYNGVNCTARIRLRF